jgi:hypothetical protein
MRFPVTGSRVTPFASVTGLRAAARLAAAFFPARFCAAVGSLFPKIFASNFFIEIVLDQLLRLQSVCRTRLTCSTNFSGDQIDVSRKSMISSLHRHETGAGGETA